MFGDSFTLHELALGFKVAFATGNSDLSGQDIEKITEADPSGQSLTDICQLALQLPQKKKLPLQFQSKGVFHLFNKWRVSELGNQISQFKAKGGMSKDGSLRFYGASGCYGLNFDADDKLVSVSHCSGDTAEVESKWGLTKQICELVENQDDFSAGIKLGFGAPMQLAKLFKSKLAATGQSKSTVFFMKPNVLDEVAERFHREWGDNRKKEKAELAPSQMLT